MTQYPREKAQGDDVENDDFRRQITDPPTCLAAVAENFLNLAHRKAKREHAETKVLGGVVPLSECFCVAGHAGIMAHPNLFNKC